MASQLKLLTGYPLKFGGTIARRPRLAEAKAKCLSACTIALAQGTVLSGFGLVQKGIRYVGTLCVRRAIETVFAQGTQLLAPAQSTRGLHQPLGFAESGVSVVHRNWPTGTLAVPAMAQFLADDLGR